jgi:hypothetical protein
MSKEPEVTQITLDENAPLGVSVEIPPNASPLSRKQKLAWAMIASSFVLYASLFLIPFLSWGARPKLVLFGVLFVISEVTFWGGGLILGKELFQRYRAYFNPMSWWKRSTNTGTKTVDDKKRL